MHDEPRPAGRTGDMTPPSVGRGYEARDASVRGIVTFIVGLFSVLAVTQFGLWGLLNVIVGPRTTAPPPTASAYTEPQQAGSGVMPPRGKVTPESVLEIMEQRRKLRAEEEATLGGKGRPADNTKGGAVQIPIDRAIDLIAERGLPPSGGPGRTEVEVNSHSGEPAPAAGGAPETKAAPKAEGRGAAEERTKH